MRNLWQRVARKLGRIDPAEPYPRLRKAWWRERHEAKLREAAGGSPRLVLLGDSITQGWEDEGRAAWEAVFGEVPTLNLGFSGDCTEHLLWRLLNGEIDAVDPELFVVHIGSNNSGHRRDAAADTARAIGRVVELLRGRKPSSRVLLHGLLPRGERPDDPLRLLNAEVNRRIRGLADGDRVRFIDLAGVFVGEDGWLPAGLMPDFLHLSPAAYRRWAAALEDEVRGMLAPP